MSNDKHSRRLKVLAETVRGEPYDVVQSRLKYSNLPSLLDNFCHAGIDEAVFGPRREVTLIICPLIWIGNQGSYGSSLSVRFGGIRNLEEVKATFTPQNIKRSELAYIHYDDAYPSKPGDLYISAVFERISASVTIHFSHVTVSEIVSEIEIEHIENP